MAIKKINTDLQTLSNLTASQGVVIGGGSLGSSKITLNSSNNVAYFRGGSNGLFLQNSDGSDGIYISNDSIIFETSSAEKMRISSLGNVGIGTTSPTSKLHVHGGGGSTNADKSIVKFYDVGSTANNITKKLVDATIFRSGWSNSNIYSGYFENNLTDRIGDSNIYGVSSIVTYDQDYTDASSENFDGNLFGLYSKVSISNTTGNSFAQNAYGLHVDSLDIGTNSKLTNYYGIKVSGITGAGTVTNKYALVTHADAGNVGIGTTSPETKLDTNGVILARGGSWNGGGSESNKNAAIVIEEGYQIYTRDNGTDLRVLIGKTSDYINIGHAGTSYVDGMRFYSGSSANYRWFHGNDENMRLNSTGLGIGTTSPSDKLDVGGNIRVTNVNGGNAVDSGSLLFLEGGGQTWGSDAYGFRINHDGSANNLHIQSNAGTTVTNILTLERDSGDVGIGTSTPLSKLQVNEYTVGSQGNQNIHGELSVFADSGDESLFLGIRDAAYPNRGWAFNPVTNGVNSDLQIKEHGDSAVRMTLRSAGNVGIGTTSPSTILHVKKNDATGPTITLENNSNQTYINNWGSSGPSGRTNRFEINATATSSMALAAQYISLQTVTAGDSYEKVRITSSGNVGIGVTNPQDFNSEANNLVIGTGSGAEGMTIYGGSSGGSYIYFADGTSGSALYEGFLQYRHSERAMRFGTATGVRMTLDASGNLGIGTTSPYGKLNVIPSSNPTTPTTANQIAIGESSANSWYNLRLGYFLEDGAYKGSIQSIAGNTPSTLVLNGDGGNVGIGTTSPNSVLNVEGTKTVALTSAAHFLTLGLSIDDNNTYDTLGAGGGVAFRGVNNSSGTRIVYGAIDAFKESSNTADYRGSLRFFTNQNSTAVPLERMRIDSSGNVGIGTTSPNRNLHVAGSGTTVAVKVQATDGSQASLDLQNTEGWFRLINDGGSLSIYDQADSVERFRINTSGNIGIGTTSPVAKLDIAGVGTGPSVYDYAYTQNAGARIHGNESALEIIGTDSGNHGSSILLRNGDEGFGFINNPNIDALQLKSFTANGNGFTIHGTGGSVDSLVDIMTIEKTGRVGIGTSSPAGTLHVVGLAGDQGSIYVSDIDNGANAGDSLLITKSGTNAFIYNRDGGHLRLGSNNQSSNLTINSSGDVGIGTTGPTQRLHVRSGVTNHVAKFESTDSIAEITIQDNSTYTRLLNISTDFKLMPNDGSTEFIFEGDTGNFVNPGHIKLVDNGKVQFGNSNDFDIYHNSTTNQNIIQSNLGRQLLLSSDSTVIKSDLDSTILYIDTNDGAIGDSASIRFNGSRAQVGWIDTAVTLTDGGANKDIKLKVNNGGIFLMTSNTARMFVNSSGNVGIGTTSPDYKLEVDGTLGVSRTDGIIFAGSLGTGTGNKIYSDTSNNFIISTATASAPYSSNERLRILNANGNVGIGTTNPQAKLDISTTGTGDSMIIRNNDASSSAAPVLMLLRDSASAANGDYLGQIKFKGNSDTGAERVYAKITAKISDATNGAEDSLIETAVRDNGSNLIVSRQTHQNLKLINGTGLESDGDIYMPIVGKGLIIKSPNGTRYRITVDNSGNLGTELA